MLLFTPQYDAYTAKKPEIEILIQLEQPALLMGSPAFTGGIVKEVREGLEPSFIPFDHVVLTSPEGEGEYLRGRFLPGDTVTISQEMKANRRFMCRGPQWLFPN